MVDLKQPIGIFDAGIGSYAIVERVRNAYPEQDIVYLADRASFPYGSKSREALLLSVNKSVKYLEAQGCSAIILASNAPSIMILQAVRDAAAVPVMGIFPPIQEALSVSRSKRIAVLGVESMVSSAEMASCIMELRLHDRDVSLINASPMVALVESFLFLSDPRRTQEEVNSFVRVLLEVHPDIDVMTLSSTHLPWLRPFFETAAPDVIFLDPADSVLETIRPFTSPGHGKTRCLATQTPTITTTELGLALKRLGFTGEVATVQF
jgi:glutamate racemase